MRMWPSVRGAFLAAGLGLAVLPSLVPSELAVRPSVAVPARVAAGGEPMLVRHAGMAPIVVDTTVLTGPALRGWWVDRVTGRTVDAGPIRRSPAVRFDPPDTGDGTAHDWTLVVVDGTRGLRPPA